MKPFREALEQLLDFYDANFPNEDVPHSYFVSYEVTSVSGNKIHNTVIDEHPISWVKDTNRHDNNQRVRLLFYKELSLKESKEFTSLYLGN
jgi:hypothetical protein